MDTDISAIDLSQLIVDAALLRRVCFSSWKALLMEKQDTMLIDKLLSETDRSNILAFFEKEVCRGQALCALLKHRIARSSKSIVVICGSEDSCLRHFNYAKSCNIGDVKMYTSQTELQLGISSLKWNARHWHQQLSMFRVLVFDFMLFSFFAQCSLVDSGDLDSAVICLPYESFNSAEVSSMYIQIYKKSTRICTLVVGPIPCRVSEIAEEAHRLESCTYSTMLRYSDEAFLQRLRPCETLQLHVCPLANVSMQRSLLGVSKRINLKQDPIAALKNICLRLSHKMKKFEKIMNAYDSRTPSILKSHYETEVLRWGLADADYFSLRLKQMQEFKRFFSNFFEIVTTLGSMCGLFCLMRIDRHIFKQQKYERIQTNRLHVDKINGDMDVIVWASLCDAFSVLCFALGSSSCRIALQGCALSAKRSPTILQFMKYMYCASVPSYEPWIPSDSMGVLQKGLTSLPSDYRPLPIQDAIEAVQLCCENLIHSIDSFGAWWTSADGTHEDGEIKLTIWPSLDNRTDSLDVLSPSARILINLLQSSVKSGTVFSATIFCRSSFASQALEDLISLLISFCQPPRKANVYSIRNLRNIKVLPRFSEKESIDYSGISTLAFVSDEEDCLVFHPVTADIEISYHIDFPTSAEVHFRRHVLCESDVSHYLSLPDTWKFVNRHLKKYANAENDMYGRGLSPRATCPSLYSTVHGMMYWESLLRYHHTVSSCYFGQCLCQDEELTPKSLVWICRKTGACIDLHDAMKIIRSYCTALSFYKPVSTPYRAFFLTELGFNENNKKSEYKCSVALCSSPSDRILMIEGLLCDSEINAKTFAALAVCKRLHEKGHLDHQFKINNAAIISNVSRSVPIAELSQSPGVEDGDVATASSGLVENANDASWLYPQDFEEIVVVDTRIVPESFIPDTLMSQVSDHPFSIDDNDYTKNPFETPSISLVEHYIYHFSPSVFSDSGRQTIENCLSCKSYIQAISNSSIAFLLPLSENIIKEGFTICLRNEIIVTVHLKYDGCFLLPVCTETFYDRDLNVGANVLSNAELLISMQRYHKAVCCWEVAATGSHPSLRRAVDIREWTCCSGGAYYIVLPRSDCHSVHETERKQKNPEYLSEEWKHMVKRSSIAAADLVWNIYYMDKLYHSTKNNSYGDSFGGNPLKLSAHIPNYNLKPKDLFGKLFCRNSTDWYVGYESNSPVSFNDVLKYVKSESASSAIEPSHESSSVERVAVTYADHYRKNRVILEKDLDDFVADPDYRLVAAYNKARNLSFEVLLKGLVGANESHRAKHAHLGSVQLPAEYSFVLGDTIWLYTCQCLPSILWRLQSLVFSSEASTAIRNQLKLNLPEHIFCNLESLSISPSLILEGLTPRKTQESINNERLEILGDTILKFIVSVNIFELHPDMNEHALTSLRGDYVSNYNLYRSVIDTRIFQFLRGQIFADGHKTVFYRPSGMKASTKFVDEYLSLWNTKSENELDGFDPDVERCNELNLRSDVELLEDDTITSKSCKHYDLKGSMHYSMVNASPDKTTSTFPLVSAIELKAKVLSDLAEALIGIFYESGGYGAAEALIMGLKIMPVRPEEFVTDPCGDSVTYTDNLSTKIPGHSIRDSGEKELKNIIIEELNGSGDDQSDSCSFERVVDFNGELSLSSIDELLCKLSWSNKSAAGDNNTADFGPLEVSLGYSFRNLDYLSAAMNHAFGGRMVSRKRVSFERLEFLGDSVLDAAVMTALYRAQSWATPGHLSFQKHDATSNIRLAVMAMELGLDRFINRSNIPLRFLEPFNEIEKWRRNREKSYTTSDSIESNTDEVQWSAVADYKQSKSYNQMDFMDLSVSELMVHEWKSDSETHMLRALMKIRRAFINPFASHVAFLLKYKDMKKVMADLFEAVVGAMFLDAGKSLDCISQLVLKLNMLPQLTLDSEEG